MKKRFGAIAAIVSLAVSASAQASVQLGEVPSEGQAIGNCFDGFNLVQANSGGAYEVPAGGGVITGWQHQGVGGLSNQPGSGRLQVWRATDQPGNFNLVGRSDEVTFTAGVLSDSDTRIPVNGGDLIGLRAQAMAGCMFPAAAGDLVRFSVTGSTDPDVGSVEGLPSSSVGYRINVSATLEPDADGDAYGDETQDQCPTDATTQNACPDTKGPKVKITGAPNDKVKTTDKKATVKVSFTSEKGATFECRLDDDGYESCTSPYRVKVKSKGGKGLKHRISVRATDRAGNLGKAATVEFRVIRK